MNIDDLRVYLLARYETLTRDLTQIQDLTERLAMLARINEVADLVRLLDVKTPAQPKDTQ